MKKVKSIPKFKTIAEEAKFWDSHDISDYLSEMKEVKVSYKPSTPKQETIVIRVSSNLKKRLEIIAREEDLALSSLIRAWLAEKLKKQDYYSA